MIIEFIIIYISFLFSCIMFMLASINKNIEENKKELNKIKKDNYELSELIIKDLNQIKYLKGD